MSWDAYLYTTETRNCPHCSGVLDQTEQEVIWRNYTHNTNGMIAAAYEAVTGSSTEQCGARSAKRSGRRGGSAWTGLAGPTVPRTSRTSSKGLRVTLNGSGR